MTSPVNVTGDSERATEIRNTLTDDLLANGMIKSSGGGVGVPCGATGEVRPGGTHALGHLSRNPVARAELRDQLSHAGAMLHIAAASPRATRVRGGA